MVYFSNWNGDNSSDPEKKSKFHGAFSQIYRLDKLQQSANNNSRNINYPAWNEDIDAVWRELAADTKPENWDIYKKFNEILNLLGLYSIGEKLKLENPKLFSKIISLQKEILTKKDIFVRELQNKQGKGTAYEDSMDDYMD